MATLTQAVPTEGGVMRGLEGTGFGRVSEDYGAGPAPFSPADIAGLVLWYDASDTGTVTMSGANVTAITGHAGFGTSLTPPVASTITKGSRLGRDTLLFGSGTAGLSGVLASVWTSSQLSTFAAANFTDGVTFAGAVGLASTDDPNPWETVRSMIVMSKEPNFPGMNYANTVGGGQVGPASSYTGWHIHAIVTTATGVTVTVDGTSVATGSKVNGTMSSERVGIGGRAQGSSTTDGFRGDIGEVVMYDRTLTAPEQAQVVGYLSGRWIGATVATAPTLTVATPGNTTVSLTWTAPSSNGGSAITDYQVEKSANGTTGWTSAESTTSTALGATITGLTNGTIQYFRVSAVNPVGTGPPSNVMSATPLAAPTAPGTPTGLSATPSSTQVALSWTAPSDGGSAITNYVVEWRTTTGPGSWNSFGSGTSTSRTVTSLTNGVSYDFHVAATNAIGTGSFSTTATATPVVGSGFCKSRGFNWDASNHVDFTLGNLAGVASVPQTMVAVVRLTATGHDAELFIAPSYDPVDWFYAHGSTSIGIANGPDFANGPSWTTGDGWVLWAQRSPSSGNVKWSKSIYSGSAWPTPTHTTATTALTSRTWPSSGLISVSDPAVPINADIVLVARFSTELSDAQINNMINGKAAIKGTSGITNCWELDLSTPADTIGTSTLSAVSGTVLSSTDSPFPT